MYKICLVGLIIFLCFTGFKTCSKENLDALERYHHHYEVVGILEKIKITKQVSTLDSMVNIDIFFKDGRYVTYSKFTPSFFDGKVFKKGQKVIIKVNSRTNKLMDIKLMRQKKK